jgi:hypothetical protein
MKFLQEETEETEFAITVEFAALAFFADSGTDHNPCFSTPHDC